MATKAQQRSRKAKKRKIKTQVTRTQKGRQKQGKRRQLERAKRFTRKGRPTVRQQARSIAKAMPKGQNIVGSVLMKKNKAYAVWIERRSTRKGEADKYRVMRAILEPAKDGGMKFTSAGKPRVMQAPVRSYQTAYSVYLDMIDYAQKTLRYKMVSDRSDAKKVMDAIFGDYTMRVERSDKGGKRGTYKKRGAKKKAAQKGAAKKKAKKKAAKKSAAKKKAKKKGASKKLDRKQLVSQAKRLGIKATGTSEQIRNRISAKKRRSRKQQGRKQQGRKQETRKRRSRKAKATKGRFYF